PCPAPAGERQPGTPTPRRWPAWPIRRPTRRRRSKATGRFSRGPYSDDSGKDRWRDAGSPKPPADVVGAEFPQRDQRGDADQDRAGEIIIIFAESRRE